MTEFLCSDAEKKSKRFSIAVCHHGRLSKDEKPLDGGYAPNAIAEFVNLI
jgi:hypothetical protein